MQSLKSFAKLAAEGVMAAKWEHFVQMQLYMGHYGLAWALYGAVNKNDDGLHLELIQFDPTIYQRYLARAAMIIDAIEPPKRIGTSPGFFKCKFCDHAKVCHLGGKPVENCRTCVYSSPREGGQWHCLFNPPGEPISPAKQRIGCDRYKLNPVFSIK